MKEMSPLQQSQVLDSFISRLKDFAPLRQGNPWESLAADFQRLGLDRNTSNALISFANQQTEASGREPPRTRLLHPMEREFISPEAYAYLLDLARVGLLGPGQFESLLEACAYLTSLPASRAQVQKLVMRQFTEQLHAQGLDVSH